MGERNTNFMRAVMILALLIGSYRLFYHYNYPLITTVYKTAKEPYPAEITIQENERKRIAPTFTEWLGPYCPR